MHEAQHGIQALEGFASGGTPDNYADAVFRPLYPEVYDRDALIMRNYEKTMSEAEGEIDKLYGFEESDHFIDKYNRMVGDNIEEGESLGDPDDCFDELIKNYDVQNLGPEFESAAKKYIEAEIKMSLTAENNPHTLYRQLAGETEARTVEDRLTMSTAERKKAYPIREGGDCSF